MNVMPSDSRYKILREFARLIAWACNPHLLPCIDMDLAEPEQAALIVKLKNIMQDYIDKNSGPLFDFVAGME